MKNLLLFLIGLAISLVFIEVSKKIEGCEFLYSLGMFGYVVVFMGFILTLDRELTSETKQPCHVESNNNKMERLLNTKIGKELVWLMVGGVQCHNGDRLVRVYKRWITV